MVLRLEKYIQIEQMIRTILVHPIQSNVKKS